MSALDAAIGRLSKANADRLTLVVNGRAYSGWTEIRVTRGIERFPSDFDLAVTETFPGQGRDVIAKPGDRCVVKLGPDVVLTGFVDRLAITVDAGEHTLRLTGRGRCQDLADCAALPDKPTLQGTSVLPIAQQLAAPYKITVSSLSGEGAGQLFAVAANAGETIYEIVERLARYEGLLVYEDADGNLVLGTAGARKHASGCSEGVNVQAAQAGFGMDQRFSDYIALTNVSAAFASEATASAPQVRDPNVPRYRPHVVVSEQATLDVALATRRATWEMARRAGRSSTITVTVDAWRDSARLLWQPNYLVPVHVPSCKVLNQTWCIGEVSYLRGRQGTLAQLTLMPPDAFLPEPVLLDPLGLAIAAAVRGEAPQPLAADTPNTPLLGAS